MGELRRDDCRDEWVVIAPHRQERIYHPAECPLCPTLPGGPATELPAAEFDVAVFENRFAPFRTDDESAGSSAIEPGAVKPSYGRAEVVVYTPEHEGSLGALPLERIDALLRVWTHRYEALSALPGIQYVFIFENRGPEIGVTLQHPHGQIYAYSFVPPIPARELAAEAAHQESSGSCLHCAVLARERAQQQRVLIEQEQVVAYVPFAARWSYEVHIALVPHRTSLLELSSTERKALGAALQAVLQAYDRLFGRPMPYLLAVRQKPTAQDTRDGHLRIELLPALRSADKLKYRAGSETFMGVFINDVAPEQAAAELRAALTAR